MAKKCKHFISALAVTAFAAFLYMAGCYGYIAEPYMVNAGEIVTPDTELQRENTAAEPLEEPAEITDLTEAFAVILQGVTKEFIAGYPIDNTFLMWLDAGYGDEAVYLIAAGVLDKEMDVGLWYDVTGASIHALWAEYCRDSGFQTDRLGDTYWIDCASREKTVLSFTGDFNLAEDWCTTENMDAQPNGIHDCISEELLHMMQESDILLMNNEFPYSDRGQPVPGKAYTFCASSDRVKLLQTFGADIVTLANNHAYDYGEDALFDTMKLLRDEDIVYVGAGKNLDEASKIVYYIANGRKIAILSATEIERSVKYTREATEDRSGVLKTLNPSYFTELIRKADANSDYVIAVVHWGTEGNLYADSKQTGMARQFVEAGADAVIGGHPHRLQGVGFFDEVPVAYSLGNFWFSDGTLYTTLAQVVISDDGNLQLKFVPCLQKDLTTKLITDKNEMDEFYRYVAAISNDIGLDEEGYIYSKTDDGYPEAVRYNADTDTTPVIGMEDNEGRAIDIVGNLR